MERVKQEAWLVALPEEFELLKQCTTMLEQQLTVVCNDQRAITQQQVAMQSTLESLGNTVAMLTMQMTGVQQQLGEILKAINSLMAIQAGQQAKTIATTTNATTRATRQLVAGLQCILALRRRRPRRTNDGQRLCPIRRFESGYSQHSRWLTPKARNTQILARDAVH